MACWEILNKGLQIYTADSRDYIHVQCCSDRLSFLYNIRQEIGSILLIPRLIYLSMFSFSFEKSAVDLIILFACQDYCISVYVF
jgi:hypothetical protein